MRQTALLRFCIGGLIGLSAFNAGFLAYPLEGLVTWFAYIIIGWALLSAVTVGGWVAACHIVWWRQRRRIRSISTRASRPVGNHALTSSAAVEIIHVPGEDADQGTAPDDVASLLVPGEKRILRLT